ncbi:MAG TPA: extracellular solute-binding protein [Firmicutes bacterium]|nr:extracellular solute-binding protein [Bacillota bacterium]
MRRGFRIIVFAMVTLVLIFSVWVNAASPPKPKELSIAAVSGVEVRGLKAIAPIWEKETGIKLKIIEYPYASLYEKIVTAFQANVSTFDLIMLDDPWMPKFCSSGWLVPLDKEFGYTKDPDIFQVVYDLGSWPPPRGPVPPGEKGKPRHLYGITLVGNVEIFMYRKDLVPEPKTWAEVLANGKKIHNASKPLYGFVIRGAKGNPVISEFTPILMAFGGRIFDDNWKVVLNSPESIAALKFFAEDLKAISQPGCDAYDAGERAQEVAAGRGAQAEVWPAEVTDIVENPEVSKVVGKMAYTVVPAGPTGVRAPLMGNWLLAIPKASANKHWAYEFITWATSARIQKIYAENGGIPFRRSILMDPELNKKYPLFQAMARSLEAPAQWRPRTQDWFAAEAILGTYVNGTLAGQYKPEEAIAKAAAEIQKYMEEAGYYK